LPQTAATRRSLQFPAVILATALIALLIARDASQWRNFRWTAFWHYSANISIWCVLLAVGVVYVAYAIRALRWRVLAGWNHASALRLFSPTIIGFTAIALLGRAGELARPWLISAREQVNFESQVLVWGVERLFDTAAALALIGITLIGKSESLPYLSAFRTAGIILVVVVAALTDLPTGDVEDGAFARHVVLHADIEMLAGGIEDAARPLGGEVVQGGDADAAVTHLVIILAVGQAVPQVVVVRRLERGFGIFVQDLVARAWLGSSR